jgi:uncharacterized protein
MTVGHLLQLNVGRMRGTHDHIERHFEASVFPREDDEAFRIVTPVEIAFEVIKDGERVRLVGDVVSTLELTCSRCLEPYGCPVHADFDLQYVPQVFNQGEGELEVGAADLATSFYEDDIIGLDHLVREQFYLALPMKPLCRDDCQGLCPQCGSNLNVGRCVCVAEWEDPRLAVLKTIIKRES